MVNKDKNENTNIKNMGIYIHIPFCKTKCSYCDFVSFSGCTKEIETEYINSLLKQIETENFSSLLKSPINPNKYIIDTIYIGGGTPSFINASYIGKILQKIFEKFNVSNNVEITIEGNPESLNKDKLNTYKSFGINRLSIGVQSTNDDILKILNRPHDFQKVKDIFNYAKNIFRTNLDLIFGVPNQNINILKKDLNNILSLNPDSVSVYSLILEPGTNMYKNRFKLKFPNEDAERKMQKYIYTFLEQNGYQRYEISNFAKKGFESLHNIHTWNQNEYIGYGLNAASYINGTRFNCTTKLNDFISFYRDKKINKPILFLQEKQSKEDMQKEHVLLGLRLKEYNTKAFYDKFGQKVETVFTNELKDLEEKGLINIKKNNENETNNKNKKRNSFNTISLTARGLDVANYVWSYFI